MSVIRPQTQVHDGFATIRTRGLSRTRSRAEQLERFRITSLKSSSADFDYPTTPGNNNNDEISFLKGNYQSANDIIDTEPLYSSPSSLPCSTFRPLSEVIPLPPSPPANYVPTQNIKKNSQFSLESLQSSITPKTPDNPSEDGIFLYSAPESPQYGNILPGLNSTSHRSFDELESFIGSSSISESPPPPTEMLPMQDLSSHRNLPSKPLVSNMSQQNYNRKPPIRSATLQPKRASFAPDCKGSNGEINSIGSSKSSNGSIGNVYCNTINYHRSSSMPTSKISNYNEPKIKTLDFYNPNTNYYSPCEMNQTIVDATGGPAGNNSRTTNLSSSADILDHPYYSPAASNTAWSNVNDISVNGTNITNGVNERKGFVRRYHTLGHPRYGNSINGGGHHQQRAMTMLISNNSMGHLPNGDSDSTYWDRDINITDYIDPLDFKVGCQTTLRSKPIIPWYELAIKKDLRRKSCPPISNHNQAHVVAAFEQSLSNMTQRLQQLTATAERKDGELTDMRQTIELLRKQSIQAGLTTAHMHSMGVQQANVASSNNQQQTSDNTGIMGNSSPRKQLSQLNSNNKTSANGGTNISGNSNIGSGGQTNSSTNLTGLQRHHSSDSMCSLNSISSGCSAQDKKKKKGWLRSSFTKAFSRNAKISKTNRHMGNNGHNGLEHNGSSLSTGSSFNDSNNITSLPPPSPTKNGSPQKTVTIVENAKPVDAIELEGNTVVEDLKKQLREKDLVLTDIRLEALSSASQLESLKDTVMKMRAEMISLKQNNERLQKLVTSRSLAGSEISLGAAISPNGSINESRRYSLADGSSRPPMELPKSLEEEVEEENIPPAPAPEPPPPPISPSTHIDLTPPPPAIEAPSPTHLTPAAVEELPDITDGKKISIAVYLGQPESFAKYLEEIYETDNFFAQPNVIKNDDTAEEVSNKNENGFEDRKYSNPNLNEFIIAYTYISGKTSWQNLDYIVRKTFKDYVARIDPGTNLGLNTDSITSYHLGEAKRGPEVGFPELLPCGYIIGNVKTLYICLQGVGSLAFDSLIPRSIVHRYISLLTEHRRLILCGPSGTGKSYLARKLAEFLVARSGRGNLSEAIATFNVDHKSSKELRHYLGHIAEQASMSNGASELPSVIILDNLHHASALGDVFSCLLSAGPAAKLPCIIGTMSQATCNTTNLQLHHNFRWVLTANHMEPVKGFLGRFLRRRLFTLELQTQSHQTELTTVLAWLPTVWQHINRFLENHSSSDVTIGPRLFLSCPLDLKDSQVWFTDVWNYHLAPYLVEAVREGVQLYGRRGGAWNDPSTFIRDTYPWQYGPDSVPPSLRQINAEDVGLEGGAVGNSDSQDPLLNMLMRLQEAANYSGNQEQESDCASLDSNITPDSSAGAE